MAALSRCRASARRFPDRTAVPDIASDRLFGGCAADGCEDRTGRRVAGKLRRGRGRLVVDSRSATFMAAGIWAVLVCTPGAADEKGRTDSVHQVVVYS